MDRKSSSAECLSCDDESTNKTEKLNKVGADRDVIANSSASDGQLAFSQETFRLINSEDSIMVNKMLNDEGLDSDIIAQIWTETVNWRSLHTLRPKTWLKDDIIKFEMTILNQMHADGGECYLFNSFLSQSYWMRGTIIYF